MSNEVKIITRPEEEAEKADIVVCAAYDGELMLTDNLTGPCSMCGRMLQWRPTAPKSPPKACYPCAMPKIMASAKDGDLKMMITPKTAKEVMTYLAAKDTDTKH